MFNVYINEIYIIYIIIIIKIIIIRFFVFLRIFFKDFKINFRKYNINII